MCGYPGWGRTGDHGSGIGGGRSREEGLATSSRSRRRRVQDAIVTEFPYSLQHFPYVLVVLLLIGRIDESVVKAAYDKVVDVWPQQSFV